jgi:hypothetical protein
MQGLRTTDFFATDCTKICRTSHLPRSGGLRSAMPMGSQCAARITSHCPHMVRRFGDHLSLRRTHLTLFNSLPFDVQCWAFDVRCSSPKEWWTPIRHAHGKPMSGENHFSLSTHGQAIRRSPLLAKNAPHTLRFSSIRRSMLGVRCSMFISPKEWWTPIRHAHGKPMCGENHFSLSPHGQAIRRSPLLGKDAPHALPFSSIRRSMLGVRCSMFISPKEWWTPIRHAHGKPMSGENHFSLSPHGHGIKSPSLK